MRLRRIVMPETAKAGEVVEIKAVILHPMIRGHSFGTANELARRIIHTFRVTYDGADVFRAELFPGIAANPQFTFHTTATRTGEVRFEWTDDTGEQAAETRTLTVEAA